MIIEAFVAEPGNDYEDNEPALKAQRKKKAKVDVPMGSNGRPKKRVMKERTFKDAKGYMRPFRRTCRVSYRLTRSAESEDYSEYETDNDPPQPEKPKETKEAKEAKPKAKAVVKPKPEKKAATASKPGQKTMTNFFGKAKK